MGGRGRGREGFEVGVFFGEENKKQRKRNETSQSVALKSQQYQDMHIAFHSVKFSFVWKYRLIPTLTKLSIFT